MLPARAQLLFLSAMMCACAGNGNGAPVAPASSSGGPRVAFVYVTTDGEELSSQTTRGRATALLFLTTYDLASQLMARRLDAVLRRHVPRANGAAIVLEPPKHQVMAQAFRSALNLSYPVAMGEDGSGARGPVGEVERVPLLIVLDRSGVETFRHYGVLPEAEIHDALAAASRRGSPFGP